MRTIVITITMKLVDGLLNVINASKRDKYRVRAVNYQLKIQ